MALEGGVAQALEHEGKGDAGGTQRTSERQERAGAKPHPHLATWALRDGVGGNGS